MRFDRGVGRRISLLAGAAVLLGAACSLVSGDEFTGGSPIGTDAGEASTPAPVDGGDAAVGAPDGDGGRDASTSPCASRHTFCDDFDQTVLTDLWEVPTVAAGTFVYDSKAWTSPPRSLVVTCTTENCSLTKHFPKANHFVASFELQQGDPASDMSVMQVGFAGLDLGFTLNLSSNVLNYQVCDSTGCDYTSKAVGSPSPTRFHLVTIDIVTASSVTVSFDGVPADSAPLAASGLSGFVFAFGCGDGCDHSSIRLDDVVVDLE
jgi:hypothetical protein